MAASAELAAVIHTRRECGFLPLRLCLHEGVEVLFLPVDESEAGHDVR